MVAAPLRADELLRRADLAGYARVVSADNARAVLRFTTLLKGRPQGSGLWVRLGLARTAVVAIRRAAHAPDGVIYLGEWSDEGAYQPGARVKTHLAWNAAGAVYETLWWNAVTRLG